MVIYLDHAATTSVRECARDAWWQVSQTVGNASSVHGAGREARRVLEEARESVAADLGCQPIELIFTSGGTESINLALKGMWWARDAAASEILLPDGEHHATMDTAAWLAAHEGATVRSVPLSAAGAIDTHAFARALPGSALATAMVANNEVGTLNDIPRLAHAAATAGVPLHVDAVGAAGILPLDFRALRGDAPGGTGLAAMSVSGHKVGAPVGTGALVVSRHSTPTPLLHGGGHQRGLRSGTQDVAGAAAFAAALREATVQREAEYAAQVTLRDKILRAVASSMPEVEVMGDREKRLPGNANLYFPGAAGETLLFLLDMAGIAVSTGSACQAGVTEPSHVVLAMGRDEGVARSVLRISVGRSTSEDDVDALIAALPSAYERAKASGALSAGRS